MKKAIIYTSIVSLALAAMSYKPSENLSIKVYNPCSERIPFGHGSKPGSVNIILSVSAGNTGYMTAKKGEWVSYRPAPGKSYVAIGQVEYKGQVFKCGCE